MNIRYILYGSLFLFAGLTASVPVFAAEDTLAEEAFDFIENEGGGDDYISPTIPNLSKLYWAIDKLDLENDEQIDSYLMINECTLYRQYHHNEFEWAKIQQATREYIIKNKNEFPTKFEIIGALALGRYDIEKEEFEIVEEDQIKSLRRLDFAMNSQLDQETCIKAGEIYDYPLNIIVILNRPLVLKKIPVKRELAQLYIENAKKFYNDLPPDLKEREQKRLVFLRLKIRIIQYKDTVQVARGELRSVVFGRLDGFEIYADQKKKNPLYFKDLRKKRLRRSRNRSKKEE